MRTIIYCACVLFGLNILFVAWLTLLGYFRARAARLKNAANADGQPGDRARIPFGLRDRLMARILESRLDE